MSWSGRRKFDLKCFRRKSTVSSHTVCNSKELICTPDSTTDMCSNQCYRHKCCATDTSAEVQTQVLCYRHKCYTTDMCTMLQTQVMCSDTTVVAAAGARDSFVLVMEELSQSVWASASHYPKTTWHSPCSTYVCNSPFPLYHPPLYPLSLHSANLWTLFACFIVFRLRRVHDIFALFVWLVHYLVHHLVHYLVHHYYNALVPRPDTSNVHVLLKTLVFSCILRSRKSSVDCQDQVMQASA